MDELTVMRSFRSERVTQNFTARTAAWRVLEDRIESESETSKPVAAPPVPSRRLLPRRRLLALVGAATVAAAVAGSIVVLGSGPTAQPAAAEILRETATVAASADAPAASPLPGPGQFLYRKTRRLELKSWVPGGESMVGGRMTRPGAFTALVSTTEDWWVASDGAGRVRETASGLRFLTSEEQSRWEAAGSRLPAPFDPEYQEKYPLAFSDALELGHGVVDRETSALDGFQLPDTSRLPTEAKELRLAVEANRTSVGGFNLVDPSADRLDPEATVAQLLNILAEGSATMTPQLRAAAFDALAEMPGIEVDTEATDFLGRRGNAIRSVDLETGNGTEFIFDPDTAEMLAQREFLGDRGRNAYTKGLPAGLTVREVAYLDSAIVGSTDQTGADGS